MNQCKVETKRTHFKMYKAGKVWLFASVAMISLATGTLSGTSVLADDSQPVTTTQSSGDQSPGSASTTQATASQGVDTSQGQQAPQSTQASTATNTEVAATSNESTMPVNTTTRTTDETPSQSNDQVATESQAVQDPTPNSNNQGVQQSITNQSPTAQVTETAPSTGGGTTPTTNQPANQQTSSYPVNASQAPTDQSSSNQVTIDYSNKVKNKQVDNSEQKADETSTNTEKSHNKTANIEKTAEKSSLKNTDQKARAQTKKYIDFDDVKDDNPKQYRRIVVSKTTDNGQEYYVYSEKDNKFTLADNEVMKEIAAAKDAKKLKTYYWEDQDKLKEALDDPEKEFADRWILVRDSKTLPEGIGKNYIETQAQEFYDKQSESRPENATDLIFIPDGEEYLVYDPKSETFESATDEQKVLITNALKDPNAPVKSRYQTNTEQLEKDYDSNLKFSGMFLIRTTNEEPSIPSVTRYTGERIDYHSPNSGIESAETKTIYKDNGKYYIFNNGVFSMLSDSDEALIDYKNAVNKAVTNYLPKDYESELQKAVNDNQSFVQIDGQIYKIVLTPPGQELDQNTAAYTITSPVKIDKTDGQEANEKLVPLDTVNPSKNGLISVIDYTVDEENKFTDEIGANKGHTIKFSRGGSNIEHVLDEPWNNYWSKGATGGIVKNQLNDKGYPVTAVGEEESLEYLFNPSTNSEFIESKMKNGHPDMFISDGEGGFSFDSTKNHAILNEDGTNIIIYNKANKPSEDKSGQFFPLAELQNFFDDDAPIGYETSGNKELHHYFGVSMETNYVQPANGQIEHNGEKKPMKFSFSGDDDFWLFIDGKLVLDIGGIHDTLSGSINFATGDIEIPTYANDSGENIPTNLKDIFGADWQETGKQHTMKIFYLERGNNLSNLKVDFNLQLPENYHAENTQYDRVVVPIDPIYIYAENQDFSYTENPVYSYATSDRFGVELVDELIPPVTPDPDPNPDPDPDPIPEKPSPETPTPEKPTTPEIEVEQGLPGHPDEEAETGADLEDAEGLPGLPSKSTTGRKQTKQVGTQTGSQSRKAASESAIAQPMGLGAQTPSVSGSKAESPTPLANQSTQTAAPTETPAQPTSPDKIDQQSILPQTGDESSHSMTIAGMVVLAISAVLGGLKLARRKVK